MSDDARKVPIIILSVSFVLIVFVGLAILFNWPGPQDARMPAASAGPGTDVAAGNAWVHPDLANNPASDPATAAGQQAPVYTDLAGNAASVGQLTPGNAELSGGQPTGGTGDGISAVSGNNIVIYYGNNPDPSALNNVTGSSGTANVSVPAPGNATATPAKTYTPAPATPATSRNSGTTQAQSSGSAAARPSAGTAAVASGPRTEYWIQAASLSNRSRAEDLQATLLSSNLSAIINLHEVDGKTWYRVRIGPYQKRPEAEGWLGTIRKLPNCAEAYVSEVSVRP